MCCNESIMKSVMGLLRQISKLIQTIFRWVVFKICVYCAAITYDVMLLIREGEMMYNNLSKLCGMSKYIRSIRVVRIFRVVNTQQVKIIVLFSINESQRIHQPPHFVVMLQATHVLTDMSELRCSNILCYHCYFIQYF